MRLLLRPLHILIQTRQRRQTPIEIEPTAGRAAARIAGAAVGRGTAVAVGGGAGRTAAEGGPGSFAAETAEAGGATPPGRGFGGGGEGGGAGEIGGGGADAVGGLAGADVFFDVGPDGARARRLDGVGGWDGGGGGGGCGGADPSIVVSSRTSKRGGVGVGCATPGQFSCHPGFGGGVRGGIVPDFGRRDGALGRRVGRGDDERGETG